MISSLLRHGVETSLSWLAISRSIADGFATGRKKLVTEKMPVPLQIPLLVTVDPDESPSAQIHNDLEVVVRLGLINDVPGKSARAVIRYRDITAAQFLPAGNPTSFIGDLRTTDQDMDANFVVPAVDLDHGKPVEKMREYWFSGLLQPAVEEPATPWKPDEVLKFQSSKHLPFVRGLYINFIKPFLLTPSYVPIKVFFVH